MRYFGWMHPAAKRRRLLVETLLDAAIVLSPVTPSVSWHLHCPHCQAFALVPLALINLGVAAFWRLTAAWAGGWQSLRWVLAALILVVPFLALGRRLSSGLGPRTYRYAS